MEQDTHTYVGIVQNETQVENLKVGYDWPQVEGVPARHHAM